MLRKRRMPSSIPSWEDAKLAVEEIGGWVKNADAKITILAAVLGVTVTLLSSRASEIVQVVRFGHGLGRDVVLFAGLIAVACLVATAHRIVRALVPRYSGLQQRAVPNRFSWPELAAGQVDAIPDPASAAEDAWEQARNLARIARAKYSNFKAALRYFLLGVGSVVLCLGAAAWVLAEPLSS